MIQPQLASTENVPRKFSANIHFISTTSVFIAMNNIPAPHLKMFYFLGAGLCRKMIEREGDERELKSIKLERETGNNGTFSNFQSLWAQEKDSKLCGTRKIRRFTFFYSENFLEKGEENVKRDQGECGQHMPDAIRFDTCQNLKGQFKKKRNNKQTSNSRCLPFFSGIIFNFYIKKFIWYIFILIEDYSLKNNSKRKGNKKKSHNFFI